MTRRFGQGLGLAALVVLLDQLTKLWVTGFLTDPARLGRRVELTPFFELVLVGNRGVSFGMFNTEGGLNTLVLSALALAIVAGLLIWLRRVDGPWMTAAIGLVIGGALGNMLDRVRLGAVVDFLYFHWGTWYFPAFNVADSGITVGVAMILLDGLLGRAESPT